MIGINLRLVYLLEGMMCVASYSIALSTTRQGLNNPGMTFGPELIVNTVHLMGMLITVVRTVLETH